MMEGSPKPLFNQVRRTTYAFVHFHTRPLRSAPVQLVSAISILKGAHCRLTPRELDLLQTLPTDRWTQASGLDPHEGDRLISLAEKGLIVTDSDDPVLADLRRADEKLGANRWSIFSAQYHFMSRWRDVGLADQQDGDTTGSIATREEDVRPYLEEHGYPPNAFHRRNDAGAIHDLPTSRREGPLYDTLRHRATTRAFDPTVPLALEDLSTILYNVYGCHGTTEVVKDVLTVLRKTSPSGGSLHPTECYPLIHNVEGVPTGLYHYNAERHALEELELFGPDVAETLVLEFTAGQDHFRSPHALFIMTGRFFRQTWKYGKHPRAYSVLMMDAGHLSQTLYLVATELGLGAFTTAAINAINIDERLGLDPFSEGTIAVSGCGVPLEGSEVDTACVPYDPVTRRSADRD